MNIEDLLLAFDLPPRPAWYADAACRGMDVNLFFPDRGQVAHRARLVCDGCPVQDQCAEAGKDERYGIWGGGSRKSRRTAKPIPHGTYSGYKTHIRRGESPCEACRAANRRHTQDARARKEAAA